MRFTSKSVRQLIIFIVILSVLVAVVVLNQTNIARLLKGEAMAPIKLPQPLLQSTTSIEQALNARRSVRDYSNEPLTLQQVGQLLWAAQGITSKDGFRTAPSAGALYPLEVYVVSGNVNGLPKGVYKYNPTDHSLKPLSNNDKRAELSIAAMNQLSVQKAAVDIVITGVLSRTTLKYADKGTRFVYMEAGHAAENVYLQSVSLGLGMVAIGAFDDATMMRVMGLSKEETPLYILSIGKK